MALVSAMKFPRFWFIGGPGFFAGIAGWSATAAIATDGDPIAPVHAPFPMPQFARRAFPDRVFNIRDYGAVADGVTENTAAIGRATAARAEAGGTLVHEAGPPAQRSLSQQCAHRRTWRAVRFVE